MFLLFHIGTELLGTKGTIFANFIINVPFFEYLEHFIANWKMAMAITKVQLYPFVIISI